MKLVLQLLGVSAVSWLLTLWFNIMDFSISPVVEGWLVVSLTVIYAQLTDRVYFDNWLQYVLKKGTFAVVSAVIYAVFKDFDPIEVEQALQNIAGFAITGGLLFAGYLVVSTSSLK